MSAQSKIASRRVDEVLSHAGLDQAAIELLRMDLPVAGAIELLGVHRRALDAIRLLAHSLPKREAVWFACTCCRALIGAGLAVTDEKPVSRAEAWVFDPDDRRARAAYAEAEQSNFQSAGSWAAVAAFWSSSSLAPPDQVVVPPAHYLTGVAVVGAITLAAVVEPVGEMDARYERFLRIGLDIANGGTGRHADGRPL